MQKTRIFLLSLLFLAPNAVTEIKTSSAQDAGGFCPGGRLQPGNGEDITVDIPCEVGNGNYNYGNINIVNGGSLDFTDSVIDFWVKSIIVENDASLTAGSPATPIGSNGGLITIRLYGQDMGPGASGVLCKTDEICGIPQTTWDTNGASQVCLPPDSPDTPPAQCQVYDYFYQFHPPPVDDGNHDAYFGYKVIAVSYGGTMKLYGKKGATYDDIPSSDSGTSWVRLAASVKPGDDTLTLDKPVDWERGDHIVLTTTDYLPSHSEELIIARVLPDGKTVKLQAGVKYPHNGEVYPISVPERLGITKDHAETRAAVGLLTRSIRIVSAGDTYDPDNKKCDYNCLPPASQLFPSTEAPGTTHPYYFGGVTIVRQGAKAVQIQGVEFFQMGQGGRLGHYPVHFHHARKTPRDTFVKDSSVHDSMTRFMTLHATTDVTLARNVGYQSIGHGYYLEEGTEVNNKLFTNLGVMSRAAVINAQNPRRVPGILNAPSIPALPPQFAYRSDVINPSIFWMTNAWNDFEYNMAVGAGTCGACYWPVLASMSGHSKTMTWVGPASLQRGLARGGTAPIKNFKGNFCSSAMHSFNTTPDTAVCHGVQDGSLQFQPVPNPLAPAANADKNSEEYYPVVGQTLPAYTRCVGSCTASPSQVCTSDEDCGETDKCNLPDCGATPVCSAQNRDVCMVTVLDDYTSSFNWAETNFSAIWLRPRWFLMTNSVVTDPQNAALTFVTGGDYTNSSVISGNWMLARKTVFIGETQKAVDPTTQEVLNPYVSAGGPFNPLETADGKSKGLSCENSDVNYCMRTDEGIAMPLSNFGNNQRLYNIYDGPSLQEANAYLDIKTTSIDDCPFPNEAQQCNNSGWMYGKVLGMPGNATTGKGFLPNAAIAWKQPNGFYYPPAFHSTNLFFNNVDIRHFVVEPLFLPETATAWFKTDEQKTKEKYATWNPASFDNFTAIDRQTILNDDDGSLTGLKDTVSVNEDPFFNAPIETLECASNGTAKTSPYEHVTSVVYPACGTGCDPAVWSPNCTANCYGVPLYRQYLTGPENETPDPNTKIRMMGPAIGGRINLTSNNAKYYVSTTDGVAAQAPAAFKNIFETGQTYYLFLVYAQPSTTQTYQIYVGAENPGFEITNLKAVRVNLATLALSFDDQTWPAGWTRSYDTTTGILTVTMNLSEFSPEFTAAKENACQPKPFCEWNSGGGTCDCSGTLQGDNPELYQECLEKLGAEQATVCDWSIRDIDCPLFDDAGVKKSRCLGIAITMPGNFVADGVDRRPAPECFPDDAAWNTPFQPVDAALAGACAGEPIPPAQFCDSVAGEGGGFGSGPGGGGGGGETGENGGGDTGGVGGTTGGGSGPTHGFQPVARGVGGCSVSFTDSGGFGISWTWLLALPVLGTATRMRTRREQRA